MALFAQAGTKKPEVRASGEATVSAQPDRAEIDIGVVTEAKSAQAAASKNAESTSAVITRIKALLGGSGSVRTLNYSLNPKYSYPQNSPAVLDGYTANNTVKATIDDLSLVGKLIDASTGAGSNSINGIRFTLKNDETVRAEALKEAARKARASAEAIAQALGLRVVGVISAEAGGGASVIHPQMMMAAKAAAPTPIEAGPIDVNATVTVTLEVAQ